MIAQSALWFTVGAGLLLGVTLQVAAAVVALYLVITTIPAPHAPRSPHGRHASSLAPA